MSCNKNDNDYWGKESHPFSFCVAIIIIAIIALIILGVGVWGLITLIEFMKGGIA